MYMVASDVCVIEYTWHLEPFGLASSRHEPYGMARARADKMSSIFKL